MPIDYSKWDKLELSDDSDVEVHPNVDKNSFIKWKQRDIHEKRLQRNHEIKSILVQLTMYAKLNERVDYLLDTLNVSAFQDNTQVMKTLDAKFDKSERFDYDALIKKKGDSLRKGLKDLQFDAAEIENTPPYNEMIEDLLIQIKEDHPDAATDASKLIDYMKDHRAKIDDILSKQTIKMDELLYQKSLLISSDDYHTGFDKSFLNKEKEEEAKIAEAKEAEAKAKAEAKKKETSSVTSIETLNSPSVQEQAERDALDELEVTPETAEFSKISMTDYKASTEYLIKHSWICTEQQKDALIMTAFDYQLEGNTSTTKQIIHQSLILQYIGQLAGVNPNRDSRIKAIKLFMGKLSDPAYPVRNGFLQDVDNTFNHIVKRCEIIKQEHASGAGEEEGEALIQLRALDEDTQLSVSIPPEGTEEYKIFTTEIPPEMQQAVKTQSLEEVNKVFASYKIEQAEEILEVINRCGVIGISGVLENENDFQELQKQYQNQEIEEIGENEELEADTSVVYNDKDTTDIVD